MTADARIVATVGALDAYLRVHERACGRLQQSFLKLAQARRHLPPHALSDLSFREHFDAETVVARTTVDGVDGDDDVGAEGPGDDLDAADDDSVRWQLTTPSSRSSSSDSKWESERLQNQKHERVGLTQRRPASATGETAQTTQLQTEAASSRSDDPQQQQQQWRQPPDRQSAPLLWFSSLPPSALRQAQQLFRGALQDLVIAATSVAKVQQQQQQQSVGAA